MKTCSKCKVPKNESAFYRCYRSRNPSAVYSFCKDCCRLDSRKRHHYDPEASRLKRIRFKNRRPGYWAESQYGLTVSDLQHLLELQAGGCAICKEKFLKTPHVDHDHESGRVRGLLCRACNTAIGMLKDSSAVSQLATEYLKRHGK